MANKKTFPLRVDEWTFNELTELKKLTGVTYGNLVRHAIPLLDKKYKRKKVVKETDNGER